jgi:(1->4)-alpha-D-glucan 1-alpha-D-glucosylmutase
MPAPLCTYRVQLHAGFGFDDVAAIAPYLARLGVSHVYCSPYLQAAPGSTHGYDVVDHSRLNEELGGEPAFERMVAALAAAGLGHIVDIVPNHMSVAAGRRNSWWWDVLENGPSSRFASFFDIDWTPADERLRQRVLLPVLGDHYGRVLEAGELRVEREGGSFVVRYFEHEAPLSPRTVDELLAGAATTCGSDELESQAVAFGRLPPATATDRDSVDERHRDKEVLKARLARLLDEAPEAAKAVDEALAAVNADPDRLDALLQRQNFRLAFWRTAGQELDYRRFFDVPELVALRVEDPRVFEESHQLVLRLVAEGKVDGLRIDHPDGLRDPAGSRRR